jgi:hypothetical protein
MYQNLVCTICAQDFTRRTSANRHNANLHQGTAVIVTFVEYIVGRVSGIYQAADPRQCRRKAKKNRYFPAAAGFSKTAPASLADTAGGFTDSNGFRNQDSGQPINFQLIPTTPSPAMIHNSLIDSFIRRYEEVKLQEKIIEREERQKARTHEVFENLIRAIDLSRIQNKEDPSSQIQDLVDAGILVPISFIDVNGNPAIRYEHHTLANAAMAPQNVCGALTFADMLKIIETAYRRNIEFVMKFIEARGGEDHFGGIEHEKKLSDSISPSKTTSTGTQRLKPEGHKSEDDSHAPLKEEREKSRNEKEPEMIQKYRTRELEQKDPLFMTITDMTNNRLPPFGKAGQPQRQYSPDNEHPDFFDQYAKPGDQDPNTKGLTVRASASSLTTAPSTIYIDASGGIVDKADIKGHLDNQNKAKSASSKKGRVQGETIDELYSTKKCSVADSPNTEAKIKESLESSKQTPVKRPLANLVPAAKRQRELAVVGVTSSQASAGYPPSCVLNNNSNDSWIGKGIDSWIQLDLGSRKNIHRINIAWSRHNSGPISFALSVSQDGVTFAEKRIGSSDQVWPTYTMYDLPSNTCGRYVKICNNGMSRDDRFGISGISIFGLN